MAVTMYELVQAAVTGKEVECRACGCGDEGIIGKLYRGSASVKNSFYGIRPKTIPTHTIRLLPAIYHEGSFSPILILEGWKWRINNIDEIEAEFMNKITIL